MKKLTVLLCIAGLLANMIVYADSTPDAYSSEDKIEKLKQYNIVHCYEDGNFHPEKNITRAEFCKMVSIMTGMTKEYSSDSNSLFADVPTEHWANQYVMFCFDNGLVKGVSIPQNLFAPDNNITFQDSLKILVCALGYEELAKASGGYPTGYVEVAKELEIINTAFDGADYISRGDAADVIYKTLFVPLVVKNEDGTVLTVADGNNDIPLQTLYLKYFKEQN